MVVSTMQTSNASEQTFRDAFRHTLHQAFTSIDLNYQEHWNRPIDGADARVREKDAEIVRLRQQVGQLEGKVTQLEEMVEQVGGKVEGSATSHNVILEEREANNGRYIPSSRQDLAAGRPREVSLSNEIAAANAALEQAQAQATTHTGPTVEEVERLKATHTSSINELKKDHAASIDRLERIVHNKNPDLEAANIYHEWEDEIREHNEAMFKQKSRTFQMELTLKTYGLPVPE